MEQQLITALDVTFPRAIIFPRKKTPSEADAVLPPAERWVGTHPSFQPEHFYCPEGWTLLLTSKTHFSKEDEERVMCFHGTTVNAIPKIIKGALRKSGDAAGSDHSKGGTVYFSPSLAYASHPRYARPYLLGADANGVDVYAQCVLLVSVDPAVIYQRQAETMTVKDRAIIDAHFPKNQNLEYLAHVDPGSEYLTAPRAKVLGVMIRLTGDLGLEPDAHWWKLFWDMDCWGKPPFH